jgi:hypothetical protein
VVPVSVKQVDFVTAGRSIDHSLFGEVVRWAFPRESTILKPILILFLERLLLFRDEENNFVCTSWCDDTSRKGMETGIPPKLG